MNNLNFNFGVCDFESNITEDQLSYVDHTKLAEYALTWIFLNIIPMQAFTMRTTLGFQAYSPPTETVKRCESETKLTKVLLQLFKKRGS